MMVRSHAQGLAASCMPFPSKTDALNLGCKTPVNKNQG